MRAIIKKNMKYWDEILPHVEFVYNRAMHSSIYYSPFEIVYGFNLLIPLDLFPLSMSEQVNLDGVQKAGFIRNLHEKVRQNIERRNQQVANQRNKGCKQLIFEPKDWVWLHLRKEMFHTQK